MAEVESVVRTTLEEIEKVLSTKTVVGEPMTIEGNKVSWELLGKGKLTAPLEISNKDNCQNYTLENYNTSRNIDVGIRVNPDDGIRLISAKLFNPHEVIDEYHSYCNSDDYGVVEANLGYCNTTELIYNSNNDTWTVLGGYYTHYFDRYEAHGENGVEFFWNVTDQRSWTDITNINKISHATGDIFYVTDVPMAEGQERTVELCSQRRITLGNQISAKYDFMFKPSSLTFSDALSSGNYVLVDPYYNGTNCTSRKQLDITNPTGGAVNITLNVTADLSGWNELAVTSIDGETPYQWVNLTHLNGTAELLIEFTNLPIGNSSYYLNNMSTDQRRYRLGDLKSNIFGLDGAGYTNGTSLADDTGELYHWWYQGTNAWLDSSQKASGNLSVLMDSGSGGGIIRDNITSFQYNVSLCVYLYYSGLDEVLNEYLIGYGETQTYLGFRSGYGPNVWYHDGAWQNSTEYMNVGWNKLCIGVDSTATATWYWNNKKLASGDSITAATRHEFHCNGVDITFENMWDNIWMTAWYGTNQPNVSIGALDTQEIPAENLAVIQYLEAIYWDDDEVDYALNVTLINLESSTSSSLSLDVDDRFNISIIDVGTIAAQSVKTYRFTNTSALRSTSDTTFNITTSDMYYGTTHYNSSIIGMFIPGQVGAAVAPTKNRQVLRVGGTL